MSVYGALRIDGIECNSVRQEKIGDFVVSIFR